MDLLDLQMMVAIAETGSLSGAAARLQVGQPTLSIRMKQLELELGQSLVVRSTHGVQFTAAGLTLLEGARRALAVVEGTKEQVAQSRERPQLRLGALPSVASYFLPDALATLVDAVDVHVDSGDAPDLIRKLVSGELEAAILVDGQTPPGLADTPICQVPVVGVTTGQPGLGLDGATALRERGLAFFPFAEAAQDLPQRLTDAYGPLPRLIKVCPVEMGRAFALRGYVTFLPELTVAADLAAGTLVPLAFPDLPAFWWDLKLVHRARKQLSPGVSLLRQALGLPA